MSTSSDSFSPEMPRSSVLLPVVTVKVNITVVRYNISPFRIASRTLKEYGAQGAHSPFSSFCQPFRAVQNGWPPTSSLLAPFDLSRSMHIFDSLQAV